MRILIVGRGHVGTFLRHRLSVPDELHWTRDMFELSPEEIRRLKPELVVNAAGKTDLRWCEDHGVECMRHNVEGPIRVWRALQEARGQDAWMVHMSSGCIWDGPYQKDGKPFRADDPPTPACMYSWSKASCDALLLREAPKGLAILRPRQIFSPIPSPRNTLMKLVSYPELIDTPNTMTSAETLAKTVQWIAATPSLMDRPSLIMAVYDCGVTSPYKVGAMLAKAGLRAEPKLLAKSGLDSWHRPKRVDVVLSDLVFESQIDPPHVDRSLARDINLLAENLKTQV